VLALLAEGKSNREIAQALVVEVSTVKWYLKILYSKLHVHSRTQAIIQADAVLSVS
jgi:ATP/maltotriose-dependent transcriptional regulator MalT